MTTLAANLLTWHHVHDWADSLPDAWTARPGSCIECPIAKYLIDVSPSKWVVGVDKAVPDADYHSEIDMPRWVTLFIDAVDVHTTPIGKARLLELLERCKPEEEQ